MLDRAKAERFKNRVQTIDWLPAQSYKVSRDGSISAPERADKSQVPLNTVSWVLDQGSHSGNTFWIMPTEADARRAVGEHIIPVMHKRPARQTRTPRHGQSTLRIKTGKCKT